MPNFTEQAIQRAFIGLLEEKPFDKVTVLDIAERCGINRNTFYYHYHDVYDLLDHVLTEEEERVLDDELLDSGSWENSLLALTKWARENERAIKNVYRSINRDRIENYVFETSQRIMERYIRTQARGIDVEERDVESLSLLYSAACEGVILNWLREGMHEDFGDFIEKTALIYDSLAPLSLQRVSELRRSGQLG